MQSRPSSQYDLDALYNLHLKDMRLDARITEPVFHPLVQDVRRKPRIVQDEKPCPALLDFFDLLKAHPAACMEQDASTVTHARLDSGSTPRLFATGRRRSSRADASEEWLPLRQWDLLRHMSSRKATMNAPYKMRTLHVCLYIYIHICIYIYIWLYMCMYIHWCTCIHTHR